MLVGQIGCAATAALGAQIATFPLDVIRRKMVHICVVDIPMRAISHIYIYIYIMIYKDTYNLFFISNSCHMVQYWTAFAIRLKTRHGNSQVLM
jgi:hypothetical protein